MSHKEKMTKSQRKNWHAEQRRARVTVQGDVARIELIGGGTAIVDAKDAELVSAHTWYGSPQRGKDGAPQYARAVVAGVRTIWLHRLILGLERGDRRLADHINSQGLDCRRANLRIASASENAMNRRVSSRSKTGVKGCYAQNGKYVAQCKGGGRVRHLGTFETLEAASRAYAAAARQFHGAFAQVAA